MTLRRDQSAAQGRLPPGTSRRPSLVRWRPEGGLLLAADRPGYRPTTLGGVAGRYQYAGRYARGADHVGYETCIFSRLDPADGPGVS